MKQAIHIRFEIDPACTEPEVIVRARERTDFTDRILSAVGQCAREDSPRIVAYDGDSRSLLHQEQVIRVHTEARKLIIWADPGRYEARCSLRELEEKLDARRFVRISRFEIVNLDRISNFDVSIAGTIHVIFEDGSSTWVARRYVRAIEQRLTGQEP